MDFRDIFRALRSIWLVDGDRKIAAKSSDTVVLGSQIAQAIDAQERHDNQGGVQHSPLADLRYSDVECRLWRWSESGVDISVEKIVIDFTNSGEPQRNIVRDSMTMDDFYTLLTFARRCALSSLRTGETYKIEMALTAMAMIELARVDWRDLLVASRLVRYAGQRLDAPLKDIVTRTAQMAEPKTAEALLADGTASINLSESCGYKEVATSEGIALFGTGYKRFAPRANLEEIAFSVAVALEDNDYEISDIEVASDIPLIWLDSDERSPIAKLAGNIAGCVRIHGAPRSDPDPLTSGQSLLVFLAEASIEQDAQEIASAAQNSSNAESTRIGVASSRLFAVTIQRSFMADTSPLEDSLSLERLRPVFDQYLGNIAQ